MSGASSQEEAPDFLVVEQDQAANRAFFIRALDIQNALHTFQPPKRDMLDLLAPTPGQSMLEIGCGLGDDARILADLVGPAGRVVGIDTNAFLLEQARLRAKDYADILEFAMEDIHRLSYGDGTFDACRCERVFQWLDDPALALREMVRVTKPGGRIVVGDTNWEWSVCSDPITQAFWQGIGAVSRNPDSGRQLSGLFRECGLLNIAIRPHLIGPIGADFTQEYLATAAVMLKEVVRRGTLTPDDLASWPAMIAASGRDGTAFAMTPFFVVAGTKSA